MRVVKLSACQGGIFDPGSFGVSEDGAEWRVLQKVGRQARIFRKAGLARVENKPLKSARTASDDTELCAKHRNL